MDVCEEFFCVTTPPGNLQSVSEDVSKFVSKHHTRRIAFVASGGTTVPVERNTVRFLDNFSSGQRGSASAEYFLSLGYAVIFLHRHSSLKPFQRHYANSNPLDWLDIDSGTLQISATISESDKERLSKILPRYAEVKEKNTLHLVPFTSVFEYFFYLKEISNILRPVGKRALFYLAAAVSDFYIKPSDMPQHKIQSSKELDLTFNHTPKMLLPLTITWAPEAFVVTFKLETEEPLLIAHAKAALDKYHHQVVVANLLETRRTAVTLVFRQSSSKYNKDYAMSFLLPILLLVLVTPILLCPSSCQAQEYYVTPTSPPNPACPSGKPCHTLSYYANNVSLFVGKENVSLLFLDGSHLLKKQFLNITHVGYLTLAGVNGESDILNEPRILIEATGIIITNISALNIHSSTYVVDFMELRDVGIVNIDQVVFENSSICITESATSKIQVSRSCFSYSKLLVFWSFEMFECPSLSGESTAISVDFSPSLEINDTVIIGGKGVNVKSTLASVLTFNNVNISNSVNGVTIEALQQSDLSPNGKWNIEFIDCILGHNNDGVKLALAFVQANITISHSSFTSNQQGLSLISNNSDVHMLVEDSHFERNEDFGLKFSSKNSLTMTNINHTLSLINVIFSYNIVESIGVVIIYGPTDVTIDTCFFRDNSGFVSTLFLHSVSVLLLGDITFSNNIGSTGGAIHMSQSTLWLNNGTEINFVNNSASDVGGAIYVEKARQNLFDILYSVYDDSSSSDCVYQLTFNVSSSDYHSIPVSLHFNNNTARIGGDDIYGASLSDDCIVTPDKQTRSYQIQDGIFDFQTRTLSSVSSVPRRVCLCEDGVPQCDKIEYIYYRNVPVTSGEKFSFSLILVGDDFGALRGSVHASFKLQENNSLTTFGSGQRLQRVTLKNKCTDIEYSVHAKEGVSEVSFLLSRDSITASAQNAFLSKSIFSVSKLEQSISAYNASHTIDFNLLYTPVVVTVNLSPCPLGFAMSNGSSPVCECETFLSGYVSNCTIVNGTGYMYRKNITTWIGKKSQSILASNFCPFGFCKTDISVPVDLHEPDEQCVFNHSGILCGVCRPNLSLALGSSQCLPCSNDGHIALFLVFAVAGVALVFFIKIFDLTVARGTINGLIFYANVIWINQSLFFPSGNAQTNQDLVQFLRVIKVFIAWINLDFGIETCFFNGLDAYWKTWLQFVFPIYLWILAALIILVCRYSTRATKFFGNNAVSVLATLFLLSYVKLLRTIVSVLGFARLQQYHPEETRWVWLLNGNVPYFELHHSFLFAVALFSLIFLCLPYVGVLLFIPFVRKISNRVMFRWINKLKPLFDAYTGPLKDNHHYWVGLTLLVRMILAIAAEVLHAFFPIVSLNIVCVISALLGFLVAHVYKNRFVFLLEFSFLLNLVIVSSAFLITTDHVCTQIILTSISGLISFVTFSSIFVFQAYFVLKTIFCYLFQRIRRRDYDNIEGTNEHISLGNNQSRIATHTSIAVRESLLESIRL